MHKDVFNENELIRDESEKVFALADEATKNTDMESLDQQMKSIMTFTKNADTYSKLSGRARIVEHDKVALCIEISNRDLGISLVSCSLYSVLSAIKEKRLLSVWIRKLVA